MASRGRRTPLANARGIRVGVTCTVPFNKQATWWGVWLDLQLTLKEHHDVRIKKDRNALRRLTGQVGLSPENC